MRSSSECSRLPHPPGASAQPTRWLIFRRAVSGIQPFPEHFTPILTIQFSIPENNTLSSHSVLWLAPHWHLQIPNKTTVFTSTVGGRISQPFFFLHLCSLYLIWNFKAALCSGILNRKSLASCEFLINFPIYCIINMANLKGASVIQGSRNLQMTLTFHFS